MSKIKMNTETFSSMKAVPSHHNAYDLVVIEPVSGKPGKLIFSATVYDESVSKAVKSLRDRVAGSGFVVLQASAYRLQHGTQIQDALIDAYEESLG